MAKKNRYGNIIIGSFVRKIGTNGKCTGHCAGKSIDINYKNGGFNTTGSLEMVINIFDYLMSLPLQYRKRMFFGLPFQGGFFKNRALPKFKSAPVSYLQDPRLREMIPHLGGVFPDNDNHLHIQVDWLK
ncbi:hypothetical protein [Aquiflexum sp.]|uniref:hypothetical protein n=1 Tax=Aquiflexum sp. TaxID=1872584 RepID=UPI0035946119